MLVAWSTWDVFTKAWTAMTTDDNMWVTHSFTSETLVSEWNESGCRRVWLRLSGYTVTTTDNGVSQADLSSDHGSDHSEEADMIGKRLVIRRN
jgi:hypothetical protein